MRCETTHSKAKQKGNACIAKKKKERKEGRSVRLAVVDEGAVLLLLSLQLRHHLLQLPLLRFHALDPAAQPSPTNNLQTVRQAERQLTERQTENALLALTADVHDFAHFLDALLQLQPALCGASLLHLLQLARQPLHLLTLLLDLLTLHHSLLPIQYN